MAEGTRLRLLDETVNTHTTQLQNLAEQLSALAVTITSFDGKRDQLRITSPNSPCIASSSPSHPTTKSFKLDFPRSDGNNPASWTFKASQFCDFHIPSNQRLQIASFHMDGPPLAWYQWVHANQPFSSWDGFLRDLEARFGNSPYTDHQGALAKLTQISTVTAYISQYESLTNQTRNLPQSFMLSNFISGLKPDNRHKVQALRPQTILDAQGLARLQEDKLMDARRRPYSPQSTPHPISLLPTPTPSLPPGVHPLTAEEMKSR